MKARDRLINLRSESSCPERRLHLDLIDVSDVKPNVIEAMMKCVKGNATIEAREGKTFLCIKREGEDASP